MATASITGSMSGLPAAAGLQSPNSSGSSSNTKSANNLSSTFLSLLTQELQNQDPTSPMDSTAMVGQMISLNQLSQLTSINQTLSTSLAGTTSAVSDLVSGNG